MPAAVLGDRRTGQLPLAAGLRDPLGQINSWMNMPSWANASRVMRSSQQLRGFPGALSSQSPIEEWAPAALWIVGVDLAAERGPGQGKKTPRCITRPRPGSQLTVHRGESAAGIIDRIKVMNAGSGPWRSTDRATASCCRPPGSARADQLLDEHAILGECLPGDEVLSATAWIPRGVVESIADRGPGPK